MTRVTACACCFVFIALVQLSPLGTTPSRAADDPGLCGPFSSGEPIGETAACLEAGVQPSRPGLRDAPDIVALEPRAVTARPASADGEALLALPKGPDGELPTDFELAPDARIAGSFFSPVMCATIARVVGPPGSSPSDLVTRLPDTAALAPHHLYATATESVRAFEPDPYRELQHGLAQLGAPRAWPLSRGEGVTLALLDSAPQADHPDLISPRLMPLDAGPSAAAAVHGTLMAGIISARDGNGVGIAGLAPGVDLIAIPTCDPEPGASDSCRLYDLLRALDQSWEAGAKIVNMSLVGPSNPILERAVSRLERLGVLLIAAAGNEMSALPRYPAAYPSVVGVGAIDRDGQTFDRGNVGVSVDVLAPGVEVLSTTIGGGFAFGDGTSMAAAHVSGVAALLMGAGESAQAVRAALLGSAEKSEPQPLASVCSMLAGLGRECPPVAGSLGMSAP